ncbi:imaginal disk growth factor 6-like [Musca vetustissima]|uniref:imaginal disk growth factor 6-like n=1 Tax=Musca vetustissima TaxID=27455 RepID=UPI002AB720B5|nr:imaginal disk growth factor 6-like [Musca vetustissima]
MQRSSIVLFISLVTCAWAIYRPPVPAAQKRLVCYYDSASFVKETLAKMVIEDLEPAFQFCTHIIYGFAGIERDTFKAKSLNENLDLDLGKGLYRKVTRLKRKYPNVKVMLSVGGDRDVDVGAGDLPNKYLELLESAIGRQRFIRTIYALIKSYGFDGVDVAFQFPKNKPKKIHGVFGSIWKRIKKTFSGNSDVDPNSEKHKEQFSALIRELKSELRTDNYSVSITVLPSVNSTKFFDIPLLDSYVDFVNLATFDFYTPERNPKEADITASLYPLTGRNPEFSVDSVVQTWLSKGFPSQKLNLGISTYGRAWKMTTDSGDSWVPPIKDVENEAPLGENTQLQGLYSFQEVCSMLPNSNNMYVKEGPNAPLKKVLADPARCNSVYAFRLADKKKNINGLWISYEDPDTAATKTAYSKNLHLGGVALFNLELDDFRGLCIGEKYPILRAIKYRLLH